ELAAAKEAAAAELSKAQEEAAAALKAAEDKAAEELAAVKADAEAAVAAAKEEAAKLVEEAKAAAESAQEAVTDAVEDVQDAAETVVEEAKDAVEDAAEDVQDAVAGAMSYADYVAADLETEVTVETYVQDKQGWWDNKGTIYTQNEEGAYFLYNMPMSQEEYDLLVPGTKIRVTGYKAEWAGEVEIIDAAYEILEAEPFLAEALDVTDLLGAEDLIAHQNQLITVKGAVVAAKKDANGNDAAFLYNWDGSGAAGNNNDLYFDVIVNDATYTFTVESYLRGEGTDVYEAVTALNIGDVIDIEGYLYWYNGANPHVIAVKAAE
ncbi:MAG: hypothetical protein GX637_05635, partial [Clostridiales bacterium]|nr:hypothetical protein [Clostridiales bacterium]